MRATGIIILCALPGVLAVGCVPRHIKPLEREPGTQAERNFQAIWEGSRCVLKRYGFPLDRQDRRAGLVTTKAVSGGHLMEALWRKDAATIFHFRENSAQNILRAARLTISRVPDSDDEFDFAIEILMARTSRPQPQITDASEVMNWRTSGFGRRLNFDDLRERESSPARPLRGYRAMIVPLGRDSDLEAIISADIRAAADTYQPQGGPWITK